MESYRHSCLVIVERRKGVCVRSHTTLRPCVQKVSSFRLPRERSGEKERGVFQPANHAVERRWADTREPNTMLNTVAKVFVVYLNTREG